MAHGGPGGDKRGPLGLFDVLAEKLEAELGLSSLRFGFLGYGESDGTPLDMTLRSRAEWRGVRSSFAVFPLLINRLCQRTDPRVVQTERLKGPTFVSSS